MLVDNVAYVLTFIISTGIAVIGILSSYNLFQEFKKPVLQILLYQQIFLFSFFIYGIWGNIAIREITSDLNLTTELSGKLALFVPVLGTPFLIVSWFMLLKLGFSLSGYNFSRPVVFIYFILFFISIFTFAFLVQNKIIEVPLKPVVFIVRALVLLNLGIHLVLFYPLVNSKHGTAKNNKIFSRIFFIYLAGVAGYSVFLFYFNLFGFISTCISIIVLFGVSILIPAFFVFKRAALFETKKEENIDFKAFCEMFEISNREAEIILEICSGKTNKAIADKLFITLQTVKDHNHRIYTKTQVKSRIQLTNLVREKTGAIPSPDSRH